MSEAERGEDAPATGFRRRRDGFTAEKRKAFLAALERFGAVKDACRVTGISKTTFYRHEKRDRTFAARCRSAQAACAGRLETLAWERATVGADQIVIRGGKVVEIRRKPSDGMLRLLMQASDPERYGPTMGRPGGETREAMEKRLRAEIAAELAPKPMTFEERRQLREEMEHRFRDIAARLGGG